MVSCEIIMEWLVHVGLSLNRIIVSISNTQSVEIRVVAQNVLEEYEEEYTEQFVSNTSDRFCNDFGLIIGNIVPMVEHEDQTHEDQEFLDDLYVSYTNRMNRRGNNMVVAPSYPTPVPHAVINHSSSTQGKPLYRDLLIRILRVEYESMDAVGRCLLNTVEYMSPEYENILNIYISDKILEDTAEARRWFQLKVDFGTQEMVGYLQIQKLLVMITSVLSLMITGMNVVIG